MHRVGIVHCEEHVGDIAYMVGENLDKLLFCDEYSLLSTCGCCWGNQKPLTIKLGINIYRIGRSKSLQVILADMVDRTIHNTALRGTLFPA